MKKSLILVGMLSIGYAYAQTDPYEGRVGINTEQPSATLNVKSKAGNTTDATKNFELQNGESTQLVTVLDNGKVGIGTDKPIFAFHIEDTRKYGADILLSSYGYTNNESWNSNHLLFRRARGESGNLRAIQGDDIGTLRFDAYDGTAYRTGLSINVKSKGEIKNGIVPMTFSLRMPSHLNSNNWHRPFGVSNTGYVAINIEDYEPLAPLHLGAARNITDHTDAEKAAFKKDVVLIDVHEGWTGQHPTTKEAKRSISSSMYRFKKGYRGHSIDFGLIDLDTTTNPFMAFSVAPNLGYPTDKDETIERMRITSAGNVGIGITTPSNKLHIKADADPLKLEGLQSGSGNALVVDANGVVKVGTAVTGATTLTGEASIECNNANRGKMNFVKDVAIGSGTGDAFAVCLKGTDGNFYWRYLYGAGGETTGTGNFGTGLQ